MWSAGGDLIDPKNCRTADGFLNAPQAVAALKTVQGRAEAGLVDPDEDDRAFDEGRSGVAFHRAFARILLDRAPADTELDRAARAVDKDLADHQHYPPTGR
ncbi:hypothetical protein ABZ848_17595 [Streptomyces sp. NPDC047081]|uniref:hypothetical protein n=1 Tax=Streptomyces sp. NPDC047081 TaxID=3154706 RepID=UPI0033C8EACD